MVTVETLPGMPGTLMFPLQPYHPPCAEVVEH